MGTRQVETGVTGETTRANLQRIRKSQNWRLEDLAELLTRAGRPMSKATLSQIETGGRRIDVDDLVALAYVLNVTPNALLLPPRPVADEPYAVELTAASWVKGDEAWDWAEGRRPLGVIIRDDDASRWRAETFDRNVHARTDDAKVPNRLFASSSPEAKILIDALNQSTRSSQFEATHAEIVHDRAPTIEEQR